MRQKNMISKQNLSWWNIMKNNYRLFKKPKIFRTGISLWEDSCRSTATLPPASLAGLPKTKYFFFAEILKNSKIKNLAEISKIKSKHFAEISLKIVTFSLKKLMLMKIAFVWNLWFQLCRPDAALEAGLARLLFAWLRSGDSPDFFNRFFFLPDIV